MQTCIRCETLREDNEFRKWRRICIICGRKEALSSYDRRALDPVWRAARAKHARELRKANPAWSMFQRVRGRAKRAGIPFDLTLEDMVIPAVCPVLGIPLVVGIGKMGSNSPTLDRVNGKKGYVHGNVHVISCRANSLKGNATLEELERITKYVRDNWPDAAIGVEVTPTKSRTRWRNKPVVRAQD